MIKTLQWIYRLGIRHERQRIKLAMIEMSRYNTQRLNKWDIDKAAGNLNDRKKSTEFEYQVGQRVSQIIQSMLEPVQTSIRETSILEGDDER